MFSSIGWGEIAILVAAGLIILGPERLPGAVSWSLKSLRQVRDYATGATSQLKEELGTDFDDLRKPLSQLNELRGMTPRAVVTKHLLDGDDSIFKAGADAKDFVKQEFGEAPLKPLSSPVPNPGTTRVPDDAPVVRSSDSPAPKDSPPAGEARDVSKWDAT